MGREAISPLIHARQAAEKSHLNGVLDAYETVCAYGSLPEAWQMLANQLAIYLDTEYFTASTAKSTLTFQSDLPLGAYFVPLSDEEVAYLASDAITALFQAKSVLALWQHIECNVKTSCIDVVTWKRVQVSQRQMLVRRCLVTLQNDDLHLLLDGVRREVVDRTYLKRLRQSSSTTDTWSPCSGSHIDVLPRLALKLSNSDAQFLRHAVDYTLPISEPQPSLAAMLLQRATTRATSFLVSPRRIQGMDDQSTSLNPILEDKPASVFTKSILNADGRSKRDTKRSSFSDYRSFVTALTNRTGSTAHRSYATGKSRPSFVTAGTAGKRSTMQTFMSLPTAGTNADDMANINQWLEKLKKKDIVPDPELENWSAGRGQHAEYKPHERDQIPLIVESVLGQTNTAVVESVRCMRVRLVRKVVHCNRRTRLKREDALQEVQQLYRAQHSHVVRLVGTYIIDDELAILTYPCAEWNLEQFLVVPMVLAERTQALRKFFSCLAKTLDFIHSFPIKHMDIKPQNILVRDIRHTPINDDDPFKIYLTDFGSSRFYPSVEDTETDSWTPFTRAYAAQEVILQEKRGLSADIFSMGCVYAEMLATLLDGLADRQSVLLEASTHVDGLKRARKGNNGKPRPYHSKATDVVDWLRSLQIAQTELSVVREWTIEMLNNDQTRRPSAREIAEDAFLPSACRSCTLRPGPEQFEAIDVLEA